MEFAQQNVFGTSDVFNTEAVTESVFETTIEADLSNGEITSPGEMLSAAFKRFGISLRMGEITKTIFDKLVVLISGAVEAGVKIIGQAIKVAIFKFGIELCAMAIKSLVETMTNMSLQPPSIDTKGVFYNFGSGATSTASTTSSNSYRGGNYGHHQPTLDNPFGNPFGTF
jgi:hypothetical protein